ncbi:hypothetical protein OZN62_12235 [Aurantiacibacter sp. MUD11]|uniref:hypothetical protein n=1 Tax=Aurantiacibacter sp. MUD11 TaxID=3003265 RepID=UPI0022AA8DA1|nr:hypothetical protein [Aurantiacibacter sp. MUD11]WAT17669.1 hypothetical protein OZN62_12235 [Aurantiacibacter sp. MUD11]
MSEEINGEVHIDEQDAAAGSKEGVVRRVLLISLLAAILILSAIWITGALTQDEGESSATATDYSADTPENPAGE